LIRISSFTSLAHGQSNSDQQNDRVAPHDFNAEEKNRHTLPAGKDIGVMLHGILEKISFSNFKGIQDPSANLVSSYLPEKYVHWGEVIADLIFNALRTRLNHDNSSFYLSELDPISMYREMAFTFHFENNLLIEELRHSKGFIKGLIDLIFSHHGKYYIVDWKSNWLGTSEEDYSSDVLQKVIVENHYDLQAAIYTEALRRYLKLVDSRPFDECFGGVYYLFLRGMHPEKTTGIYHFKSIPSVMN